ncbi:bifunctional DNA primase/polymerase [Arthrobacter crystallopoietes BAB-32]|uniref:Bifunctional DNA primase/polymerase n=1 Tax=Arthrobacter crystallopoietes BAB-32 TaxID=1246476 RepID=N1UZE0_9MICC|nr:AAA family ATPase [Arthrobacter crystallopoietes]EMY35756.1 bifunctional DNA primase/polymerase [Arthrobacter crystallopoietes BAB-32]
MTAQNEEWPEPSDTVSVVLDVLDNVRQTDANQWQASCPAHEDDSPSLAVREGDSQPLTVYCHAGCDYKDVVAALGELGVDKNVALGRGAVLNSGRLRRRKLKAVPTKPDLPQHMSELQDKYLEWHDRFLAKADQPGTKEAELLEFLTGERGLSQETIERYKLGYYDGRVTLPVRVRSKLYNVRRYLPRAKQSKMISWEGQGSPALLYPWAVLQEQKATLPVLFCEGELDALLANQESQGLFVAITGTGGAQTPPRDLSALSNRRVFIAYDADEAGRTGAEKLQQRLTAVGARAFIVDLTRLGLGPDSHQDISDYFLSYGGTAAALVEEMERVAGATRQRFQPVTAAELARPVPAMRWLVQGVWPEGSYGTLAGEKKTLKTYTSLSLALAVASGEPFLGRFPVPEPRPVLMYLGEGGQNPTALRLQRIADAMGVDLGALPLRMVFDAGDITGDEFLHQFQRAVREQKPGLVIVDPLYAYHPTGIEAQNLYDRGQMLAQIQQLAPEGCALIIADHFRKTGGKDLDLDSIAQSGVAQWADSWILQNHDAAPRVDEGQFSIGMQFGSRQWGGQQYLAEWSLGRFDETTGEHVGDLRCSVSAADWGSSSSRKNRENAATSALIQVLQEFPLQLTRNKVREEFYARHKKSQKAFDAAWDELLSAGRLVSETGQVLEGRRQVAREVWQMNPEPPPKLRLISGTADSS